jgi:GPI-anchor transamidase subunit GAA1
MGRSPLLLLLLLMDFVFSPSPSPPAFFFWVLQLDKDVGADQALLRVLSYSVPRAEMQFHTTTGAAVRPNSNASLGRTVVAAVRSRKSDGKEALVLSTRYGHTHRRGHWTGVSLCIAFMEYLATEAPWLARDVLFVATDANGDGTALETWLDDYFHVGADMLRGGNIQAALNVDAPVPVQSFSKLVARLHGYNGRLPNLDFLNTVQRVSAHSAGFNDFLLKLTDSPVALPTEFDPQGKTAQFLTFMRDQARGVPTGDHGAFSRFFIDSLTLSPVSGSRREQFDARSLVVVVEGTFRSLNNLLERFHQSFYYYLLPSPSTYVPIGDYMIMLGMLLAGFGLQAVIDVIVLGYRADASTVFYPLLSVLVIYTLSGLVLFLVPAVAPRPYIAEALAVTHVVTYVVSLLIAPVVEGGRRLDGRAFKLFAVVPFVLFVGPLSLLNFSFCFVAAAIVLPVLLVMRATGSRVVRFVLLALLAVVSPANVVFQASLHVDGAPPLDLIRTVYEEHDRFGTFMFPFATLVLAPLHVCLVRLVLAGRP